MQIYLLKDLPGKGKAGDIINVNDGYGKNYLVKNKIGQIVTPEILSKVRAKNESDSFHLNEQKAAISAVIKRLGETIIYVTAKVGDGKLFGAVTGNEIAKALNAAGFEIEKKNIALPEPIKALGEYKLVVHFPHGMRGEFKLHVIANG
ncbi:MAG: 50S ribosomal protein L9 [Firmicutes bacterium]|nr:50S ribosomal protein L9 [Bacillota bacterium]